MSARRRQVEIDRALPELIELFLIAASAGHPVASALTVVAPRAPAATRSAVAAASAQRERGLPLAECLQRLAAELGPSSAPLAAALTQAAAEGVPLVPMLRAVAATAHDQRRRSAQEAARRLPVTMLFPMVACILPAALVLAVVPVLVVSLSSLSP